MSNTAEFCEGCVHVKVCKYTETIRESEAFLQDLYKSSGEILSSAGLNCSEKFLITMSVNDAQNRWNFTITDERPKKLCGSCPDAGSEYVVDNSRFVQCKRTDMWHSENEECSLENKT